MLSVFIPMTEFLNKRIEIMYISFVKNIIRSDPRRAVSLLEKAFYFHQKPAGGDKFDLVGSHQYMLGIQYITSV